MPDETADHPSPGIPGGRAYWVVPGRLMAGDYPGNADPEVARGKLDAIVAAGIRHVVNLMEEDETAYDGRRFRPYADHLEGAGVSVRRIAVRDLTAPTAATMSLILDDIDRAIDDARPVYVHCWGGRGRTGTMVGCWLARHGLATGDAALREITRLRRRCVDASSDSPQTADQLALVRGWER